MKTTTYPVLLLILCTALSGCGSVASKGAAVSGETNANKVLVKDALSQLKKAVAPRGCDHIDSVVAEVVHKPTGKKGFQRSTERWRFNGCGTQYSYLISFEGDGKNGTYVSLREEM